MLNRKQYVMILVLIIMADLPVLAGIGCKQKAARCDYDGTLIQPLYEVNFTFEDRSTKRFCCVTNALMDLKEEKKKVIITVTDEVSGQKIDVGLAFFVESDVITVPHVRNNIHVFAEREAAEKHARQFDGELIKNPFK